MANPSLLHGHVPTDDHDKQVEMIATSIATTVTSSSLASSGDDIVMMVAGGSEEDSLQLSSDKGDGNDGEDDARPGGDGSGGNAKGSHDDYGVSDKNEAGGGNQGENGGTSAICPTPGAEGADASGGGGGGVEPEGESNSRCATVVVSMRAWCRKVGVLWA